MSLQIAKILSLVSDLFFSFRETGDVESVLGRFWEMIQESGDPSFVYALEQIALGLDGHDNKLLFMSFHRLKNLVSGAPIPDRYQNWITRIDYLLARLVSYDEVVGGEDGTL